MTEPLKPTWLDLGDDSTAVMRVPGGMLIHATVETRHEDHGSRVAAAMSFVPCSPSEFVSFVRGKYEEQAQTLLKTKTPPPPGT